MIGRVALASLLVGMSPATIAQAVPDVPAQQIRTLMVAAIDAPSGRATGTLADPLAQALRARFNATGPVLVEVSTLKRYRQAGCRRLNVRFRQDGVTLPDASRAGPQTVDFGIDYCRNGSAPASRS